MKNYILTIFCLFAVFNSTTAQETIYYHKKCTQRGYANILDTDVWKNIFKIKEIDYWVGESINPTEQAFEIELENITNDSILVIVQAEFEGNEHCWNGNSLIKNLNYSTDLSIMKLDIDSNLLNTILKRRNSYSYSYYCTGRGGFNNVLYFGILKRGGSFKLSTRCSYSSLDSNAKLISGKVSNPKFEILNHNCVGWGYCKPDSVYTFGSSGYLLSLYCYNIRKSKRLLEYKNFDIDFSVKPE